MIRRFPILIALAALAFVPLAAQAQVTPGTDLVGTFKRPFIMFGVGANMTFATRFFGDLSYRFGHISGETDGSDVVLAAVSTQRIQFGIGVRF